MQIHHPLGGMGNIIYEEAAKNWRQSNPSNHTRRKHNINNKDRKQQCDAFSGVQVLDRISDMVALRAIEKPHYPI